LRFLPADLARVPMTAAVSPPRQRPAPSRVKPLARLALAGVAPVRMQGLPDATGESGPEADVHVPRRGRTHGLGHREEERPVPEHRVELRRDAEFFDGLAPDGAERMLAGLDMPSGRQPQAGQPVVAEQHAPSRPVDEQEVRHQMR
jgi:hypothetical protein